MPNRTQASIVRKHRQPLRNEKLTEPQPDPEQVRAKIEEKPTPQPV